MHLIGRIDISSTHYENEKKSMHMHTHIYVYVIQKQIFSNPIYTYANTYIHGYIYIHVYMYILQVV
jgi:hypothetical protein